MRTMKCIARAVLMLGLLGMPLLAQNPINPRPVAQLRWYQANTTTSFSAGMRPYQVLFDGKNIWVSNSASNDITKLRASDDAVLGTFPTGQFPTGVAFDGVNIWVANWASSSVTRLRAS